MVGLGFVQRQLRISFAVTSGSFAGGGTTQSFEGLRISAKVVLPGSPGTPSMQAAVYGLPLATMKELCTLGMNWRKYGHDKVVLEAGDSISGYSTVFQGLILQCYADMQAAPDNCLQVSANIFLDAMGKTIAPTSRSGSVNVVSQLLQPVAAQAGYSVENNGVNTQLTDPYYSSSAGQQIMEMIEHAGIYGAVDPVGHNIAVWPQNGGRATGGVSISPTTGMDGYPAYFLAGVTAQAIFQPQARVGGTLTISGSIITPANGAYTLTSVVHDLESQMPNGRWFTSMSGISKDAIGAIPQGGSGQNN